MTDTLNRDELILTHRLWIAPCLRLAPQAAHELLEACTNDELQAIASVQGASKRDKLAVLKPLVSTVYERGMQMDRVVAAPTPDPEAPAAETPDPEAPAVEAAAAEQPSKPTRRTSRA
jgi:hypothetical protein